MPKRKYHMGRCAICGKPTKSHYSSELRMFICHVDWLEMKEYVGKCKEEGCEKECTICYINYLREEKKKRREIKEEKEEEDKQKYLHKRLRDKEFPEDFEDREDEEEVEE